MVDTIFTKIIKGEIPSYKIYEDQMVYAFLDIHPKTDGHTLVIPKKQIEFVWDLEDEDYIAVMKTAKEIARKLRAVFGYKYVGELVFGMDVPHAHVHVYGFNTPDEARRIPDSDDPVDHEKLSENAKKLAL